MHKVAHLIQISIVMICHYHTSFMAESLNMVGSKFFYFATCSIIKDPISMNQGGAKLGPSLNYGWMVHDLVQTQCNIPDVKHVI
jgi:hypothetical protein